MQCMLWTTPPLFLRPQMDRKLTSNNFDVHSSSCQPNLVAAAHTCSLLRIENICLTVTCIFAELTLVDTG
jgi:hypothetical protein